MKRKIDVNSLPKDIQVMVAEAQQRRENSIRLYDEHKKELGVVEFMSEKIEQAIAKWENTNQPVPPPNKDSEVKEAKDVNTEKV